MLQQIVVFSLIITGIYTAFQQGNVLGWLRIAAANGLDKLLGKKWSRYVQKPMWDCLPCMASVWTVVLSLCIDDLCWWTVLVLVGVAGFNACIEQMFFAEEADSPEDPLGPHINNHLK